MNESHLHGKMENDEIFADILTHPLDGFLEYGYHGQGGGDFETGITETGILEKFFPGNPDLDSDTCKSKVFAHFL